MTLVLVAAACAFACTTAHAAEVHTGVSTARSAPAAASFRTAADPCSAIPFPSVKASCENFGKSGSSGGTSITDIPGQIENAIDTWFGNLVKSALSPVLTLLGKLLLASPDLDIGRIRQLWAIVLAIADACFVLVAVVGGMVVMTHESVQSRHGLKQILPRLIFAFVASNCSLVVVDQLVAFGNAVTLAVWNQPISAAGIGDQLLGSIMASVFAPDGVTQIFTILFALVLAVMALAVLFSFAMRAAVLVLVVILAPLMLACHALPGVDAVAHLWWRALGAVLAIEFLQATVLMLMLQIFFDPDSNVLGVPTATGLVDLLLCGVLFAILLRIPGWVMRLVLGRAPRATVMGLLRTAAVAGISTAVGVPGATSARAFAGRLGARVAGGGGAGGGAAARAAHPIGARTRPAARAAAPGGARFGNAHGRPGPGGQGALFPLPPASPTPSPAPAPTAGALPPAASTAGAGWVQAPLFPDPANFGSAHGRPGSGGQGVLFPIPPGTRRPAPSPATQPAAESGPGARSGPGWVQPPLFPAASPGPITGRQQPLFRLPPGTRQQRPNPPASAPAPAATSAAGGRRRPRFIQPGLFPPSGVLPPPPTPRPHGLAPRVAGRVPPAPPDPAPRVIPVRMAAAPPPERRRGRRGRVRGSEGGDRA